MKASNINKLLNQHAQDINLNRIITGILSFNKGAGPQVYIIPRIDESIFMSSQGFFWERTFEFCENPHFITL